MSDSEVVASIKKYFSIKELVGKDTYEKYGERAWRFLDFRLLHALLIVREGIGSPMFANNWDLGGKFDERGLRSNVQEILKAQTDKGKLYLSAHIMGKACDFDVKGMSAFEVRKWILKNNHLFPFKVRLESNVDWVHLDVIHENKNPKVYLFAV